MKLSEVSLSLESFIEIPIMVLKTGSWSTHTRRIWNIGSIHDHQPRVYNLQVHHIHDWQCFAACRQFRGSGGFTISKKAGGPQLGPQSFCWSIRQNSWGWRFEEILCVSGGGESTQQTEIATSAILLRDSKPRDYTFVSASTRGMTGVHPNGAEVE